MIIIDAAAIYLDHALALSRADHLTVDQTPDLSNNIVSRITQCQYDKTNEEEIRERSFIFYVNVCLCMFKSLHFSHSLIILFLCILFLS